MSSATRLLPRVPESSREAQDGHAERAAAHRAVILSLVRQRPGITTYEIGVVSGYGQVEGNRRTTDLTKAGVLRYGGYERAGNGRRYYTVFPATPRTPEGEQARLI